MLVAPATGRHMLELLILPLAIIVLGAKASAAAPASTCWASQKASSGESVELFEEQSDGALTKRAEWVLPSSDPRVAIKVQYMDVTDAALGKPRFIDIDGHVPVSPIASKSALILVFDREKRSFQRPAPLPQVDGAPMSIYVPTHMKMSEGQFMAGKIEANGWLGFIVAGDAGEPFASGFFDFKNLGGRDALVSAARRQLADLHAKDCKPVTPLPLPPASSGKGMLAPPPTKPSI